ncbi:uncharacterized protein [Amphiura filiformis]|uniref:uncharacterized protein isoform X2 n=1 Tax=Amphiura filiformis TaxID=82378 RepID=UPI003B227F75
MCDRRSTLLLVGVTLVLLGVTSMIVGGVETKYQRQIGVDLNGLATYIGFRFYDKWAGVVFIVAGCLSLSTAKEYDDRRNRNKMMAFLVASTVAAMIAVLLVNEFILENARDKESNLILDRCLNPDSYTYLPPNESGSQERREMQTF